MTASRRFEPHLLTMVSILAGVALSTLPRESRGDFFTQVVANRLPLFDDASGITLNFNANVVYVAVKVKDRNGNASADAANLKANDWQVAGNLKKLDVTADPPPTPPAFVNASYADVYWQNNFSTSAPIRNGRWLDENNGDLGQINTARVIPKITQQDFTTVKLEFDNTGDTAVTLSNIRLYENLNLANYDIDHFTNVSGTPLTLADVTIAPDSMFSEAVSGSFSPGAYRLLLADATSSDDPGSVYGVGTAQAVPEPATLFLFLAGSCAFLLHQVRRHRLGERYSHERSFLDGALGLDRRLGF
jgi:hypothetical protein